MKRERLPSGPWDLEADRSVWKHAGLPCLLRRNSSGAWCGYVGVFPGHPFHGKGYDDPHVEVHGGLTYAGECDGDPEFGICHKAAPGEPDNVWWFGFDCAHCYDLVPALLAVNAEPPDDRIYRDQAYAQRETESLAEQLAALVNS